MNEDLMKNGAFGWFELMTTDIDAVAKGVLDLGGRILKPAFDIPEVGRFCVLQDPQGAVLCAMSYVKK